MPQKLPTIELNIGAKPERFLLSYSVCGNPGCDCNGINIGLVSQEHQLAFFIDFNTEGFREKAYPDTAYSKEEIDIINAFIEFIKSPGNDKYSLGFFKKYYKAVKEGQNSRKQALDSFKPGEMICYTEVFWSEEYISRKANNKEYDVIDYYCVMPGCDCTEIQLEFFERVFKVGYREKDFSFVYDYDGKRISDVQGIGYEQAESIALGFTEKADEIFRKRHNALKTEAASFILEKFPHLMQAPGLPTRKLGRNELCHCGSGKKYKKCCLDRDIQEKGGAMRIAEN